MDTLDEDRFIVTDRDEIVRVIGALVGKPNSLSALFDEGREILLSAVLAVDAGEDAVIIDTNANPQSNAKFLASDRFQCVSNSAGATVKWSGTQAEAIVFEGRPAFRIALPTTLRRIQRRGAYRVNTPVGNPVVCTIRLSTTESFEVVLCDICADGIGIVLPATPPPAVQAGARFDDAMMALPETGVAHVSLIVESVWEHESANGHKSLHAGLAFVGIRPATQSMVQRYVNKLDRMRIAALPGH